MLLETQLKDVMTSEDREVSQNCLSITSRLRIEIVTFELSDDTFKNAPLPHLPPPPPPAKKKDKKKLFDFEHTYSWKQKKQNKTIKNKRCTFARFQYIVYFLRQTKRTKPNQKNR